ncbi:MAG: alpha/beta fold hydrolase [Bacteroidetes bacterium]|nr:alpha/beta fold hydrolase [Bacteroidota bacterium]
MQSRLTSRRPRPFLRWALAGGGLLTIMLVASGCTLQGAVEALLPEAEVRHTYGIAYGSAERQALDVYRPQRGTERPVVVFLHGGRWQYGSKAQYRLLGRTLAQHGVVTVVPNYRLYPPATFPAWVNDAAAAVRWTYDHAHRFGGDATRLYVVGHSAGAHTATLLALDDRYLRKAGVPPGAVQGVVSMAGPVDVEWTAPDIQALMGPRERWAATYPAAQVDGTGIPLLLLHGTADETVAAGNATRLATRIRSAGGCADAIRYPGVGHLRIVLGLHFPWLMGGLVLHDLLSFIDAPTTC